MKNFKITIEYDGTDFVGWQRQPNGRTVQEEIENALAKIFSRKITVVGAGRTDSGVHARRQVANFIIDTVMPANDLLRSLNGLTSEDIVLHTIDEVTGDFSARYSAKARSYQYVVSKKPTAIERKFCWQLGYELDTALMNKAALMIIDSHDFQSFCRTESNVDHYLCNVTDAQWREEISTRLVFDITANRFLHGMVRAVVGTMIDVGRKFITLDDFQKIIEARDRKKAGQSAPAQGLFLEQVIY